MKDSRDINSADRRAMLRAILRSSEKQIIITHGTYTMPETARYLQTQLGAVKKTVVLTGSFIPLIGFADSDGPFNIGFALAQVAHLSPGVWICMNGQVFKPQNVTKVLARGKFAKLFGDR